MITWNRKPHFILPVAIPEKRWKLRQTLELFKRGHSINEIAKMLRKSREGVRNQLQREGLLPPTSSTLGESGPEILRGKVRRNPPYGFRFERGRAVRHPQEFETFLIIRSLRKSELNAREIADKLNEQRLRPRLAKLWDRCTVHRILEWHEQHPDFFNEVLSRQRQAASEFPALDTPIPRCPTGAETLNQS